jgi:hypothetical protein
VTDIPAGPPVPPPPLPPQPYQPYQPYQGPGGAAPVEAGFAGPAAQRRLTVLVRVILAIPQIVVLYLVGIAAWVVLVVAWFCALVIGRLPEFAADFLPGVLRWQARVAAYLLLLTDQYPPFSFDDTDYPVRVAVRPGPLNRLAVLFRIILVIPAAVVVGVLTYGLETIVLFVVWLIVLITGRMPDPLHEAITAVLRYTLRYIGYFFMLTSEYPRGLFGDQPAPGGLPGTGPGPAQEYPAGPGFPAAAGSAPAFPSAAGSPPAPAQPAQPAQPMDDDDQPVGSIEGYQQVSGTGPEPVWGPPAPAWSQPPPGSTPPYGTPGPAGYGPPPAAGYGPPPGGYGTPQAAGYGTEPVPASGTQPAVATAGWSVPGAPPWPLFLSAGAKRLVGLFIAVGLIVGVAVVIGVAISANGTASRAAALSETDTAFRGLSTSMSAFATQTAACRSSHTPLRCVTTADQRAGSAFGLYASAQSAIGMPTSSTASASSLLVTDATHAQQVFQQLAASKSIAQYQKTVSASDLQQVLDQLEQTYQRLHTDLAGG